jgi:hypothetical protein
MAAVKHNTIPKSDEELKVIVESVGYQFIGVQSKRPKPDSKKAKRYISMICPEGHAIEITVENFKIQPDGKPKRKCKVCKAVKLGNSKRTNIEEWCAYTGITPVSEYKDKRTPYVWRCMNGHEFTSTFNAIKSYEQPCKLC